MKGLEKRGPFGFKMGPVRRWLAQRETLIKRPKFFKNPHGSSEYSVRYIDLTTGRTQEKKFTEREMYDLYKQQREGKVSIVSIHKGSNPQLAIDRKVPIEEVVEITAKLPWARGWAEGIAKMAGYTPGTSEYDAQVERLSRFVAKRLVGVV